MLARHRAGTLPPPRRTHGKLPPSACQHHIEASDDTQIHIGVRARQRVAGIRRAACVDSQRFRAAWRAEAITFVYPNIFSRSQLTAIARQLARQNATMVLGATRNRLLFGLPGSSPGSVKQLIFLLGPPPGGRCKFNQPQPSSGPPLLQQLGGSGSTRLHGVAGPGNRADARQHGRPPLASVPRWREFREVV